MTWFAESAEQADDAEAGKGRVSCDAVFSAVSASGAVALCSAVSAVTEEGKMRGMEGKRTGFAARDSRGQSTLEYILVLAAILVAVIVAANSLIRPAVNQQMTQSQAIIQNSANNLKTNLGL